MRSLSKDRLAGRNLHSARHAVFAGFRICHARYRYRVLLYVQPADFELQSGSPIPTYGADYAEA
jgi:hypothetical protein